MSKNPSVTSLPFAFDGKMPAFNVDAFNNAINAHGVQMIHYKASPCVLGQRDLSDTLNKAHPPHHGCSYGYFYEPQVSPLTVLFTSASQSFQILDPGLLSGGTAMVTFPKFYDSPPGNGPNDANNPLVPQKEVVMAVQDRLYFKDPVGSVINMERVAKSNGVEDFLAFPALEIETILDSNGVKYKPSDYAIQNGNVLWVGNRPDAGTIYSIRYSYQCFYVIGKILHEIRVVRAVNPITGERSLVRMNYSALANRENTRRTEYVSADQGSPLSPRAQLPASAAEYSSTFLSGVSPLDINDPDKGQ